MQIKIVTRTALLRIPIIKESMAVKVANNHLRAIKRKQVMDHSALRRLRWRTFLDRKTTYSTKMFFKMMK